MSNFWNDLISGLPAPHFLQTYEWGQVKAQYGWTPFYAAWGAEGAFVLDRDPQRLSGIHHPAAAAMILKKQVLSRGFAARLSILYAPKGPLLDWADVPLRTRVINDLQSVVRKQGAIFLKIDPDLVLGRGVPLTADDAPQPGGQAAAAELERRGWIYSSDQIQFRNTVLIDLSPAEEELLARMKPKTRYNIRLAERKGVTIRSGTEEDLPVLYRMYAETSLRDGFVIRDERYYLNVWRLFMRNRAVPGAPFCEPLIAEVEGQPVAAIFLFQFAGQAYYVYGMSRSLHRDRMPTYLLQWEAIRRAKAGGCTHYDLWGAPETFDESDSMWGVYRFKEGLGGEVVRTLGAYDYAPSRLWYGLYSEVMPRILNVMRSGGKLKTRQSLG